MSSQRVLRSTSAHSSSSFDSLDEFLSEGQAILPEELHAADTIGLPAAQFEVISKDDQQPLPVPLPLLHQPSDRLRPPRPAVRLSLQPYSAIARQNRRQGQADQATHPSAGAVPGDYQPLTLLPVSEPSSADTGHLFEASFPGHLRSSRAPAGEGAPAQTGPASPLSGYAEQLQRDLAASFGNVSVQQSVPEPNSGRPAPAQQETSSFSQSAAAVMSQSIPVPHAASAATLSQAASRPAASISSAPGASFANPLMSMHARPHVEAAASSSSQAPAQKVDSRPSRGLPGAAAPAKPDSTLAPLKQVRQYGSARAGIHPLSRSLETLLKESAPAAAVPQQRSDALPAQQHTAPAQQHAAAAIPSSPVSSTVRVAQQTLRKRDFESELLDRLLNGGQAAVPAQGQQAAPAGGKQVGSCLHLPLPRVLLITVVFALMAIPLLLFTAGRVQAQHHMKQQVYVGSVAVNHSMEGGPIPDPVALPAGELGVENATGDHHAAAIAGDVGLKAALEGNHADLQEYLSAKERRRGQPGLKLLSFRLTVSLPHGMAPRFAGPRAILGNSALDRDG